VLEFREDKRAVGNLKRFNRDRKLKCNTSYALHRACLVSNWAGEYLCIGIARDSPATRGF
jgi:hypothetical protein